MEPLVFKIETQADDSGVRKYQKSISGLDVSSKKASGALKSFAQDIAQARDGADVASATLGAFSRILGSSLAATGVIIAVKTVIDGFSKIDQAVKESEKAVADAFAGMEKAGEALSFAEAVGQAKSFENTAYKIREQIKKINESPMLNIIDGLMQSTDRMRELVKQSEDQAIAIRRAGAESELAHLVRIKGLDAEGKALAANERSLQKELEGIDAIKETSTALAVTQKYAMQADEIRAKFADERGKVEADLSKQRQKDLEDQIKKEKELGEAQQKRFNELYDAEIKSQDQMQKRIDAELKAAQELADKQKALLDAQEEARSRFPAGEKGQMPGGGTTGGRPNIIGITTDTTQRPTSAEVGASQAINRAFLDGIRESTEALRQYTANQLKANGLAHDENAVTNEMIRIQKELAFEKGKELNGIADFLKGVKKAAEDLYDFNNSIKEASKTTTHFQTTMQEIEPSFDKAIKSVTNLADSMTENTGDLVKNFLKTADSTLDLGKDMTSTGNESDLLGKSFTDLSKVADNLTDKLDKDRKADKGNETLDKIHILLENNLKEMRTYAFVK